MTMPNGKEMTMLSSHDIEEVKRSIFDRFGLVGFVEEIKPTRINKKEGEDL